MRIRQLRLHEELEVVLGDSAVCNSQAQVSGSTYGNHLGSEFVQLAVTTSNV